MFGSSRNGAGHGQEDPCEPGLATFRVVGYSSIIQLFPDGLSGGRSDESPRGVDVQISREDHELGSYPVIAVVWDSYEAGYPDDYIQKCIEAFERFELPEEICQKGCERASLLREMYADMEKWFDPD